MLVEQAQSRRHVDRAELRRLKESICATRFTTQVANPFVIAV